MWTVYGMLSGCWLCSLCFLYFFKQKTAYEMRISDWSSDVCSSDLGQLVQAHALARGGQVFVGDEGAQLAEGGQRLSFDHLAIGRGQPLLVGVAEFPGHRLDRPPQPGVLGLVLYHRVHPPHHFFHPFARRSESRRAGQECAVACTYVGAPL